MIKVFEKVPKRQPRGRALINFGMQYDGWTGVEPFGVVRQVGQRWRVTCNVLVQGRRAAWFDRFEDAVKELNRLMSKADKMGQLNIGANGWPHFFATDAGKEILEQAMAALDEQVAK